MKTYLRIINPVVAVMVLLLCLWAATFEKGNFKPAEAFEGAVPTYFLAKGLFCSSALFIIGRILLLMITKTEEQKDKDRST